MNIKLIIVTFTITMHLLGCSLRNEKEAFLAAFPESQILKGVPVQIDGIIGKLVFVVVI